MVWEGGIGDVEGHLLGGKGCEPHQLPTGGAGERGSSFLSNREDSWAPPNTTHMDLAKAWKLAVCRLSLRKSVVCV